MTEADWRLFTTLVRFDPVYLGHFKCNLRRLADYPNLWALHPRALPGARGWPRPSTWTTSSGTTTGATPPSIPRGVVPAGPEIDYYTPHDREAMEPARTEPIAAAIRR